MINISKYINSITINELTGRCLFYPGPNRTNKTILVIYGHHSTIERWAGLIEALVDYGNVVVPDLPGFGGMDSFYQINKLPTLDNFADYLKDFINSYYKDQHLTIVGLSFGFIVATRMLQRYPELQSKVNLLISIVGFSSHNEFAFSKSRRIFYIKMSKLFSYRWTSWFFKTAFIDSNLINLTYKYSFNARSKFANKSRKEIKDTLNMEMGLWRNNDLQTHMHTSNDFFKLDNTKTKINLTLWHASAAQDIFFNSDLVRINLNKIYSKVHFYIIGDAKTHAPTVIANKEEIIKFIPKDILKEFARQQNFLKSCS